MRRGKSGQFLLMVSLIISILLLSVIAYVYSTKAYYTALRYQATKEIVEAITADFKRALAYVLANATHTYLNESYGSNARHNFTIGRIYAYEFLSRWKQYITYVYSELGVQVDIEYPEKTIQLHDRTRKIANLTKCYWYYPESISAAFATLKLNITKYGLYNWKTNITVSLHAWIIENSFTSDKPSNTTTFKIQVLYDDQKPYPWLWEKGQILILHPDPVNYGDWIQAEIQNVEYLGNGTYKVTIKPYLKLFQGTEQKVAPLKIILKDERGIIVELYSYKWIQLKITRNTPDTLWAYDSNGIWYTFDGTLGDQGWYGIEDSGSNNVDIYPKWWWFFGWHDSDTDPDGGLTAGDKLRFRFKKIGGTGSVQASLYSPIIELSFLKYNGEYIENKYLEMSIKTITHLQTTTFNIKIQILDPSNTPVREALLDTISGSTDWIHREYSLLPIISSGVYYGKIRIRIECVTEFQKSKTSDEWEEIQLDDVKIRKIKAFKLSTMPPEIYTLEFDWYLNLHWAGINLGLTDISWNFQNSKTEGWFYVLRPPIGFNWWGVDYTFDSGKADLNVNSTGTNKYLELKFKSNKPSWVPNLIWGDVWIWLFSPILTIINLSSYGLLSFDISSEASSSTTFKVYISTFNKLGEEKNKLVFSGSGNTDWTTITVNLTEAIDELVGQSGYTGVIWLSVYAETEASITDWQYIRIDNITLAAKRVLVIPVPSIPIKQYRVNVTYSESREVPVQYEVWKPIYWYGRKLYVPTGLADPQINFNSSNRLVFQVHFKNNVNDNIKEVTIWWLDDLDAMMKEYATSLSYREDSSHKDIISNDIDIELLDEEHHIARNLGWDLKGTAAIVLRDPENDQAFGPLFIHTFDYKSTSFLELGPGYYRSKGTWEVYSNYTGYYQWIGAPIRIFAILNTSRVGSPYNAGIDSTDYWATLQILQVTNGTKYVTIHAYFYWLNSHAGRGYWMIQLMGGSEPEYYEYIKKYEGAYGNVSESGNYDDAESIWDFLSDVFFPPEKPYFTATHWSSDIGRSFIIDLDGVRSLYSLKGEEPRFGIGFYNFLGETQRSVEYEFCNHIIDPNNLWEVIAGYTVSINKKFHLSYTVNLYGYQTGDGEDNWLMSYLYAPMFVEIYAPTYEVEV